MRGRAQKQLSYLKNKLNNITDIIEKEKVRIKIARCNAILKDQYKDSLKNRIDWLLNLLNNIPQENLEDYGYTKNKTYLKEYWLL